ncbi:MAG TPA: carboxypeptidase regulatory-like domain-containing protein, partial [Beijerinckiaceae bacterium]|nr:carboxypeptidase regulatory-like domain-containing protein [Beijerinckiaceae bacterium]
MKSLLAATIVATTVLGAGLAPKSARAQDILSGQVTSTEEGPMEGVLVMAQKTGSTMRVSVVSDAKGQYAFPASKLDPGHYTLTIRAEGYDLPASTGADLTQGNVTKTDLKLVKTGNLENQLTNADWLASAPDSPDKRQLTNCTSCHTLSRIFESTHTADEFMPLIPRMNRYGAMSTSAHPQVAPDRNPTSEPKGDALRNYATYLASINLSKGPQRNYPLHLSPRPKGRATHVVMTEYELPRPDLTEPHDVVVDSNGTVWFSSFGEQELGRLDPKTGKVTMIALPTLKPGVPTGALNLELDADGNPWLANMYQPMVVKYDQKAEKVVSYPLPSDLVDPGVQIGMVDADHDSVDGKVWIQDAGTRWFIRLDPVSNKMDGYAQPKSFPKGAHSPYGMVSDKDNNLWFFDYAGQSIGKVDAKTLDTVLYTTPTPNSRPRRGHMNDKGQIAFAEFGADKVGIFDTKTEHFDEWPTPANFAPYDAMLDKNGDLWSGGMNSDLVLRTDTKTGQSVAYLLPRETNIRRV